MAAQRTVPPSPFPRCEALVIHLRCIVPADRCPGVLDHLAGVPGVAHVVHLPGAATVPPGDLLLVDVAREAANGVVEWLQSEGVHRAGSLAIEGTAAVISDAAAAADEAAPGAGSDALVWEEVEARVRQEQEATPSFLVFMAVAALLAGIGILIDSPILIVGAMVVGPDFGPLAALSVAAVRRRWRPAARAGASLLLGLVVAAVATLVGTVALRATGLAPDAYELTDRQLTAFISHPDGLALVVALLAGIVGMLSLTQARAGALVGVLVSVTTIPAVANVGVGAAYGAGDEVLGSLAQLGLNLAGLAVAGIATLAIQDRLTNGR